MTHRPIISLKTSLIAAAFLAAYVLACFMILEQAAAHEAPTGWSYPFACCANYDCRQAKTGEVTESPDGYHTPSGEVVPYGDKRVKDSPDGEFHWCAHQAGLDAGKAICLFVPGRGS